MSQLFANTTTVTRAPASRDRVDRADQAHQAHQADQADRGRQARRSRVWALIEALGYAGAYIDPSGILAVQRLRWAEAEEARNGRR
jgi:hypothetical protein